MLNRETQDALTHILRSLLRARGEITTLTRGMPKIVARKYFAEIDTALEAVNTLQHALCENDRKVDAYDRARALVKIQGKTRAEYVLAAQAAQNRVRELETALIDIRDHGCRHDLNPTRRVSLAPEWAMSDNFWTNYVTRMDESVRERAARALRKLEGKR